MSLARTEAALTALCVDCLPGVNCEPGPGEFDGEYLQSLLGDLPAVRIAWMEGTVMDNTAVDIDSRWRVYVVTGWKGGTPMTRRVGVGAAFAIIETIVPLLHAAKLKDSEGTLATVRVVKCSNLWSGQLNQSGLAIYEIELMTPDQIDIPPAKEGPLDDWLRVGVSIDLSPDKDNPDDQPPLIPGDFRLPQ